MTEQTPATPPAAWAAALADGSGRHVAVRKHWPELAAALDAAVDAAGAVPDTAPTGQPESGMLAELHALRAVAEAAEEVAFRDTVESHNALVAALDEYRAGADADWPAASPSGDTGHPSGLPSPAAVAEELSRQLTGSPALARSPHLVDTATRVLEAITALHGGAPASASPSGDTD